MENPLLFVTIIVGVIAALTFFIWFSAHQKKTARLEAEERLRRRRDYLIERFGSSEVADGIMAHKVWQGMTSEQLLESWGSPADTDETVYKTKTKRTWKYGNIGKNRYSQRVMLENDVVVGWQNQ